MGEEEGEREGPAALNLGATSSSSSFSSCEKVGCVPGALDFLDKTRSTDGGRSAGRTSIGRRKIAWPGLDLK